MRTDESPRPLSLWQPEILRRSGPAYLAIRDFIDEAIESGDLQPGDRLPSHRALAKRLGVALGTVTRAYGEALRQGLLQGERGRGTFVSESPPDRPGMSYPQPAPETLDLYKNHPLKIANIEGPAWRDALRAMAERPDMVTQADIAWSEPQETGRRQGARWIARLGLEVSPRHIVDCPGLQAAISSILATIGKPSDVLATAALTFPIVTAIAERHGLSVVGLEMDSDGLSADALEDLCAKNPPSVLYVEPNLHAPTTALMPRARRLRLASIAERFGIWVIEMDSNGPILGRHPPPLLSHLPAQGFFIAEIWHTLNIGLRSAFVACPPHLATRLTAAASSMAGLTPQLTALLVEYWLEEGIAQRLVEARRHELTRRQSLVDRYFGTALLSHPASHHAWLRLPAEWTSDGFWLAAQRRGVALTQGAWFRVAGGPETPAARLCLGNVSSLERLESACRRLVALLEEGPSA